LGFLGINLYVYWAIEPEEALLQKEPLPDDLVCWGLQSEATVSGYAAVPV
jgi:hypothetical protein